MGELDGDRVILDELRWRLGDRPAVCEETPFGPDTLVYKVAGKMFALVAIDESPMAVSLKVEPERGEVLRTVFDAVTHAPYLDRRHWVAVRLDGSVPPAELDAWVDDSHGLVVAGLPWRRRLEVAGAAGPVLDGPRLRVRPLTESDAEAVARYRRRAEVARFQSWGTDGAAAIRAHAREQAAAGLLPGAWRQLVIERREDRSLVGDCGLHPDARGALEVGVTIDPEHQRRGHARETLELLTVWAHDRLRARSVVGYVDVRNPASIALLESCGFVRRRVHWRARQLHGEWIDDAEYRWRADGS